jgi:hypothetical protein
MMKSGPLFAIAALVLSVVVYAASQDACALCGKEIPEGAGVTTKVGDTVKTYRCIHCALTAIRSEKQIVTISAKTPLDHKTIVLTRKAGVWSQQPKGTVFLILPEKADECIDLHQPFASKAEFERYLKLNPEIAKQKPKAYTIAQYQEILEAGKPKGG